MNFVALIGMLSTLGATAIDEQRRKDEQYLNDHGWVCLGAECGSGAIHWTNLERGIGPGGPVTFQRAIWIQKTKDAIEKNRKESA